ncbi:hypothetical protein D3C80_1125550 [compost metagenome]
MLGRAALEVVGEDVLNQLEGALAELGTGLQVDHEWAPHLHRAEHRVHAVGQAALLAHFAHQAGAKGAAAEDLVAERKRSVVRIVTVDAQLREHQVGLLGREIEVRGASFGLARLFNLGQCRAFWQGRGNLRGNGFGFAAAQITDQGDDCVAGGIGLGVEGAQLLQGNRRDALGCAVTRVGIRVGAVQALEQLDTGQFARVLLLVLEAGLHLVLDACQGILREGWLADYLGEQLQRRLTLVRCTQAAQGGHGHVAVGTVAKVGTEAFEAFGDGGDVLAGHAFVEHGVGQGRQARGIAVLAAAGGEGQAQVEHRQLAGFDEQHAGAFGGVPGLDVQLSAAWRLAVQLSQRLQGVGRLGGGAGGRLRGVIRLRRLGQEESQQAQQQQQAQADQGVAGCAAFTHERSPRAVHGQRSGVRG